MSSWNIPEAWYVVQTRPYAERFVVARLADRLSIRAVYPRLQFDDGRPVPMFSRYCFARVEPGNKWWMIRSQEGVSSLLGTRDSPTPVREQAWLQNIVDRLDRDGVMRIGGDAGKFRAGDEIRVVHPGPLYGITSEVTWASAKSVAFDLMILGRKVEVRLFPWQVEGTESRESRFARELEGWLSGPRPGYQ